MDKPRSAGLVTLGMPKSVSTVTAERDPVCGMNVNPATARHVHQDEHGKYYFCSRRCLEKFESAPEQFLNKTDPGKQQGAATQAKREIQHRHSEPRAYVCPMC